MDASELQGFRWSMLAGAGAGTLASVLQAAVGASETLAFLPKRENADLAPRMVKRISEGIGIEPSPAAEWILGTLYHLSYGAAWGAAYGAAQGRRQVHPFVAGVLLGGIIYGITFPRFGGAVLMGAERPPHRRSKRMEIVLASVTLSFGVTTAFAFEALRRRRSAGVNSPSRGG